MSKIPSMYHIANRAYPGFTLFEMIVALGIFTVVVTMAISSVLALTASQKKAVALQNIQDNIRFALEAMAKEMRTGENFPGNCAPGCDELNYQTARGEWVSYRLYDNPINNTRLIQKASTATSGCLFNELARVFSDEGCYFPLTSTHVTIEALAFYVTGVGDDNIQPKIAIVIRAATQGASERVVSRINLQTVVSQRRLET